MGHDRHARGVPPLGLVTDAEFYDAFAVALVVGGSIVIPHLRRAVARMEEIPAK